MLKTAGRSKIRDVVAERLKSYILAGNLRSGDRLPTEAALAAEFGVSRLSLREATKSLEFLGVLNSKPGRGLSVGQVNMDRVTEYLGFHPAIQDVSLHELVHTRVLIETGVLPHVARTMARDGSVHRTLNRINDSLRRARRIEDRVALDIDFHHGLIAASGLSPLLAFGDLLAVFFRRFRESVKKAEWGAGVASHQRVIDSLRDGDVTRAAGELRPHIESHLERLENG